MLGAMVETLTIYIYIYIRNRVWKQKHRPVSLLLSDRDMWNADALGEVARICTYVEGLVR